MEIKLEINEEKKGAFILYDQGAKIGEMAIGISDGILTVYHTKIIPEQEGKGNAKKLLDEMVQYARENYLLVIPLCSYTLAKFQANPDEYDSIWKR